MFWRKVASALDVVKEWIKDTLAHGYSSESTKRELSNEYQHDRVFMVFKNPVHPCVLEESSFSIGWVKEWIKDSLHPRPAPLNDFP